VATIGGFLFGYDSGAVNGTQEGLRSAFGLNDAGLGFTVGSLLIGCFIGAFFAGRLADLIGRRNTMMLAAILFLCGALTQGFAHSQALFVIARLSGGMAVGAASVLSPAYISEVAPAAIRGRLTTVQQIMIIIGLTIAFVVNYFLARSAGVSTNSLWGGIEAWRWMYLMQAIPAAIFLVAEVCVLHIYVRRHAHTFSLSEIPMVLGLVLGPLFENSLRQSLTLSHGSGLLVRLRFVVHGC